jgi:hypothetical protein
VQMQMRGTAPNPLQFPTAPGSPGISATRNEQERRRLIRLMRERVKYPQGAPVLPEENLAVDLLMQLKTLGGDGNGAHSAK